MIKSIELTNFRTIHDPFSFELFPITLLTGTNNSGKSSLIKALQLLKDNIQDTKVPESLIFNMAVHHLDDISSVISKNSITESITIKIQNQESSNSSNFLELTYNKHSQLSLLELSSVIGGHTTTVLKCTPRNPHNLYYINLSYFYNIYTSQNSNKSYNGLTPFPNLDSTISSSYNQLRLFSPSFKEKNIKKSNIDKNIQLDQEILNILSSKICGISKFNELSNEFDFFLTIKDQIKADFSEVSDIDFDFLPLIKESELISLKIIDIKYFENISINHSGRLFLKYTIDKLNELLNIQFTNIKSFSYIPPDKFNQNRIFYSDSTHPVKELLFKYEITTLLDSYNYYNKINLKKDQFPFTDLELEYNRLIFVNKYLKYFNIITNDEYFFVNKYQHHLCEAIIGNIITNEVKNIADYGFGSGQLLALLIKISTCEKDILIIEEPESNLHPEYQTKLGEMFWDAMTNLKQHFIIETHSEYLVRKLQLKVAQYNSEEDGKRFENSVGLYYFDNRSSRPNNEPYIKKIYINIDGRLSEDFGTGFLDESTKIIMKLWDLPPQK